MSAVLGLSSTLVRRPVPVPPPLRNLENSYSPIGRKSTWRGLTARQSVAGRSCDRQPTAASMKQEAERLELEFAATMALCAKRGLMPKAIGVAALRR